LRFHLRLLPELRGADGRRFSIVSNLEQRSKRNAVKLQAYRCQAETKGSLGRVFVRPIPDGGVIASIRILRPLGYFPSPPGGRSYQKDDGFG